MSKQTKIEWCDATFNPWIGCHPVSTGCANCYAERLNKRFGWCVDFAGNTCFTQRRLTTQTNWNEVLKWHKKARREDFRTCHGCGKRYFAASSKKRSSDCGCGLCAGSTQVRPRVFCGSLCDWLDESVDARWLGRLLRHISRTPCLDWLLLTKRPELWSGRLRDAFVATCKDLNAVDMIKDWLQGKPPPNVWMGVTAENQAMADKRIPILVNIPAHIRFVSCEPMLTEIDLQYSCFNGADSFGPLTGIDWVICGGETGPGARPMSLEWARNLKEQCEAYDVPFFFKQVGGRVGNGGDLLDGSRYRKLPNE